MRESGPLGPEPRQRSLAKACGAIPREHAEPGHEEVRASEIEIGRERDERKRGRESGTREREGERARARALGYIRERKSECVSRV